MYKVYILKSIEKPRKSYVGLTIKPIRVRLSEHNSGLSRYTKTDKPWELIYFESFYCRTCAEKRETFLKSGIGYKFKKIILDNHKKLR
jgi:predicted GIY-YIG superfamily endonuclease